MATCMHCGASIRNYGGALWHDTGLVFPQYCRTTSENLVAQLHEPAPQRGEYTIEEIVSLGDIGTLR